MLVKEQNTNIAKINKKIVQESENLLLEKIPDEFASKQDFDVGDGSGFRNRAAKPRKEGKGLRDKSQNLISFRKVCNILKGLPPTTTLPCMRVRFCLKPQTRRHPF